MDSKIILISALVSIISSFITAYITFRFNLKQERLKWERTLNEKIVQLQTENVDQANRLIRQFAHGYLVVVHPDKEEKEKVFIPSSGRLSIGRNPDNDLVLQDRGVSRHHAIIEASGAGVYLTDLVATTGLFINGQRVPGGQRVKLSPQDIIGIGKTQMTFMHMEGK